MAREKRDYRPILEQLTAAFPDRIAISMDEAATFYGMSKRTLQRDKTFPADQHRRITLVSFARWLAG